MVSTVSPKASATPWKPMPRDGNAAASTALPQPPSTSQNVPRNSAAMRRDIENGVMPVPPLARYEPATPIASVVRADDRADRPAARVHRAVRAVEAFPPGPSGAGDVRSRLSDQALGPSGPMPAGGKGDAS